VVLAAEVAVGAEERTYGDVSCRIRGSAAARGEDRRFVLRTRLQAFTRPELLTICRTRTLGRACGSGGDFSYPEFLGDPCLALLRQGY
jgi:hypothetical protein